jgi:hypothetical protein
MGYDSPVRALTSLLAGAFLLACGAATDLEGTDPSGASASVPAPAARSPQPPAFPTSAAVPPAPPVCQPCDADDECGGLQVSCVAGDHGGFCAPGCTKEGFCRPDQVCTWVHDPRGQLWHACLPAGGPCTMPIGGAATSAHPVLHAGASAGPQAGTW